MLYRKVFRAFPISKARNNLVRYKSVEESNSDLCRSEFLYSRDMNSVNVKILRFERKSPCHHVSYSSRDRDVKSSDKSGRL